MADNLPILDFSSLGRLPQVFRAEQDRQALQGLGSLMAQGQLSPEQALGAAIKANNPNIGIAIANMLEQRSQRNLSNKRLDEAAKLSREQFEESKRHNLAAENRPLVVRDEDGNPVVINPREPTGATSVTPRAVGPMSNLVPSQGGGVPFVDQAALPPGAQLAQGGTLPTPNVSPPPPNVSGKKYKEAAGKELGEEAARQAQLPQFGEQMMSMVDQLEQKVKNPLFTSATGPTREALQNLPGTDWRRIAYERWQGPMQKGLLQRVQQDAQAINSEMNRLLLKGQGSVTENEREQINRILGGIASSSNAEQALELLNNFRGIVRKKFRMGEPGNAGGYNLSGASSPGASAAGNLPPPPPGFTVQ